MKVGARCQTPSGAFNGKGKTEMKKHSVFRVFLAPLIALSWTASPTYAANGYPTVAIADYVLGCMISNGRSREVLERCSCSIDVISSIIPYDRYVTAETFHRMAQLSGEKGVLFHQTAPARNSTAEMRRAQAEADMRCF